MPIRGTDINSFRRRIRKAQRQVPKIAAVEAERYFTQSFEREAWDGNKWKPRKKRDEGRARTDRRGLLVKSGRLKRGFQRGYAAGRHAIAIVNAVPYATTHNEGLRIKGTQQVKAHDRRQGNQRVRVKAHTRNVDFQMPQRQFMGNSNKLNRKIKKKIINHYKRILR